MIQNDDGMRISDSDLLKEHVIEFYKNLFSGGSQLYLQMGAFKALGPDNFQAIFFTKNQWEVVRDALFKLVREVFNDPEKVGELNKTLITLIPKMDHVVKMKDFRLISLCNVLINHFLGGILCEVLWHFACIFLTELTF